jgi:alanine racemase
MSANSGRTWAEIDLAVVRENVSALRAHVGLRVDVMPVVKANAYGHGLLPVAKACVAAGAEWLGVATIEEALDIRRELPATNICLLSPFCPEDAEAIVVNHITPLVGDAESARILAVVAQKLRSVARFHLEIDTGMGRSGCIPEGVVRLQSILERLPAVAITGCATHFPCAEDNPEQTREALEVLLRIKGLVEDPGSPLRPVHCANSAALLLYPETCQDLVRPGLLTYGIWPDTRQAMPAVPLAPALAWKARICQVRSVPAGWPIGYGQTHRLEKDSRIAFVSAGYGDGYPRELSDKGHVLIAGRKAPILGRVNMDSIVADVTQIPEAAVGSVATLIGSQGAEEISVLDIARMAGTTPHDVTTRIAARVPRIYRNG